MIRKTRSALLGLAVALALTVGASFNVPQNVICAVDDTSAHWDGQITSENAHMFYQFQCLQGHTFWVRGD